MRSEKRVWMLCVSPNHAMILWILIYKPNYVSYVLCDYAEIMDVLVSYSAWKFVGSDWRITIHQAIEETAKKNIQTTGLKQNFLIGSA